MSNFWVKEAVSILRQNGSRECAEAVDALAARLAEVNAENAGHVETNRQLAARLAEQTEHTQRYYSEAVVAYERRNAAERRLAEAEALLRRVREHDVSTVETDRLLRKYFTPADQPRCFRCGHAPHTGDCVNVTADQPPGAHVHSDACWEPDSGCDMGRNEKYAKVAADQPPGVAK
jgi:hypothetical protein